MPINLLKMENKKSQLHMLETIAVLAVFFILVVFVFIFYLNVSERNVEIEKGESIQLNAIDIAQKASLMEELQCSQDGVVTESCIDLLKLDSMSNIIRGNEIYFFDLFSYSRITVKEIYPDKEEWMIYDRQLEGYSDRIVTNIPITLFDPLSNKNSFGVMIVEVYSR